MSTELRNKAKKFLKKRVSAKRYQHCLRTADTASRLARSKGLDEEKAVLAGILHDVAREIPKGELASIARTCFPVYDWEESNPVVLHGKAGAAIVKEEMGIDDPEVLEAIMYHTTGFPGMGPIARLIYVCDTIEPGKKSVSRDFRQWVFTVPLECALLKIIEADLAYLHKKKAAVAGFTEILHEQIMKEVKDIETAEKK